VLAELAREADGVLIAESETRNPKLFQWGIDAQWHDAFHHAVHAALTGERSGYYASFGTLASVTAALAPAERIDPARFVVFLQNHDQVGNRARGERIAHLVPPEHAALAAAVVLESPFVPLVFQGEEWAASAPFQYFTDHTDSDLARRVSRGRRKEFKAFGWKADEVPDPQDETTYRRSQLDWSELTRAPHAAMLDLYRTLIAQRRSHA
jgi:maltooligosyltrehalose trehalohydrolase